MSSTYSDPQLAQDVADQQAIQAQYEQQCEQMETDAANCSTIGGCVNVLLELVGCIGLELEGVAGQENISADLTSENTQAQNDINVMEGADDPNDPDAIAAANDYVQQIDSMESDAKQLEADGMIDSGTADQIISSCDSIKDQFNETSSGSWGDPNAMLDVIGQWKDTDSSGGYAEQLTNLTNSGQMIATALNNWDAALKEQSDELTYTEQSLLGSINTMQTSENQWISNSTNNEITN